MEDSDMEIGIINANSDLSGKESNSLEKLFFTYYGNQKYKYRIGLYKHEFEASEKDIKSQNLEEINRFNEGILMLFHSSNFVGMKKKIQAIKSNGHNYFLEFNAIDKRECWCLRNPKQIFSLEFIMKGDWISLPPYCREMIIQKIDDLERKVRASFKSGNSNLSVKINPSSMFFVKNESTWQCSLLLIEDNDGDLLKSNYQKLEDKFKRLRDYLILSIRGLPELEDHAICKK